MQSFEVIMKRGQVQNLRSEKCGKIAFITTPQYRKSSPHSIKTFVYRYMYSLCNSFDVMVTGGTYDFVKKIVVRPYKQLTPQDLSLIKKDTRLPIVDDNVVRRWQDVICSGLKPTKPQFQGMIRIAYELVEGRLDAVIHLTEWQDKSAKPDSAVLSREANVHNVPIATDVSTAQAFIESWNSSLVTKPNGSSLFIKRKEPAAPPLRGIKKNHKVLAMVAHDNMKLELCRLAVKHATDIFDNYDYILATGTTGTWLKRFMEAMGRGQAEIKRIRRCNSGPLGGDVQIAYAVVEGLCHKIVFLQDPFVSHAHASDIRLFEQAVVAKDVHVKLATNVESAKLLIVSS